VVVVDAEPAERAERALVVDVVRLRLRLSPRASLSRVDANAVMDLVAKLSADVTTASEQIM
jgi:hypothetical protein